ncbi:hypothetical protein ADIS_0195 [Lunatimonas lonarensis]|uniref:Uncharacterized protein n=1 Tax=Lunatimonas lonarensis TaxID=1232681 RepID=R7ZZ03_9BACT|nr:hypothetical protein ADIS_0195 [Lunatimonas lonarensis]
MVPNIKTTIEWFIFSRTGSVSSGKCRFGYRGALWGKKIHPFTALDLDICTFLVEKYLADIKGKSKAGTNGLWI